MLAETKEPLVELIVSAFGEDVTQSKVHPAKTLVCYSDVYFSILEEQMESTDVKQLKEHSRKTSCTVTEPSVH